MFATPLPPPISVQLILFTVIGTTLGVIILHTIVAPDTHALNSATPTMAYMLNHLRLGLGDNT
jgi:hypothetical protein